MIKAEHLSKNFGKLHALNDVSLNVEKGEVVCLIGPSGSGKSTFLRCIHGLETPDQGKRYLDGELMDPSDTKKYRALRSKMGFVFQHFNLFPNKTVLDNCILAQVSVLKKPVEDARKTALDYLSKVGLLDKRIPIRMHCLAGRNSVWRLRGLYAWSLRSCCLTSRQVLLILK